MTWHMQTMRGNTSGPLARINRMWDCLDPPSFGTALLGSRGAEAVGTEAGPGTHPHLQGCLLLGLQCCDKSVEDIGRQRALQHTWRQMYLMEEDAPQVSGACEGQLALREPASWASIRRPRYRACQSLWPFTLTPSKVAPAPRGLDLPSQTTHAEAAGGALSSAGGASGPTCICRRSVAIWAVVSTLASLSPLARTWRVGG